MNNNEYKTTINKKFYDFKNAQKFLVSITTEKLSEKKARESYSYFITPGINELKKAKGKSINKRNKILDILENLESVFTGAYLHYNDAPSESEENIAKRIESIKGRLNEIEKKKKERDINNELFKYLNITLLIIKVQVICTKNKSRQKTKK